MQALLSDYLDNTLSARLVWEVEKHLATCTACAQFCQEMQQTVRLLQTAGRHDTSDDFMTNLHARLDGLEPEPTRRAAPGVALRDWLAGVKESLYARRIPALSLGMASLAMALILLGYHSFVPETPSNSNATSMAVISPQSPQDQDALSRHVAVTASNPFDDPVAAKLEAEASSDANGRGTLN